MPVALGRSRIERQDRDQTNPTLVADLYQRLLDVENVDVVVGGYGDNSVAPAMPLIMERKRCFLGLMALAVNAKFNYAQYFVMIPTGPHPNLALTEGFFQIAGQQKPKPETVAILVADAPFSQSPTQGAKEHLAGHGMRVVFGRQVSPVDNRLHARHARPEEGQS